MQAKARTQQQYLLQTLTVLQIPFVQAEFVHLFLLPWILRGSIQYADSSSEWFSCSMDENAKKVWRRKGRTNGALPGFLVNGEVRFVFDFSRMGNGDANEYMMLSF